MSIVNRKLLAEQAVELFYARNAELAWRYGPAGRAKCVDDARQTILFLEEALINDSYPLFYDYIGWVKILFAGLGIAIEDLTRSLDCLAELAPLHFGEPDGARAALMLRTAAAEVNALPVDDRGLIVGDGAEALLARSYLAALLDGDKRRATQLVLSAVDSGMPVKTVHLEVFQPVLREVGRLWHIHRITVAEEHFVTAATQAAMSQLYPYIFRGEVRSHVMVATCVSGELHEIGMRMVADCFELAGWDSYYLGANTPSKDVVAALRARKAQVLGISASLGRHLGQVAELVAKVRAEVVPCPFILVGGRPFTVDPDLWRKVGADGMAIDADAAVTVTGIVEAAK